MWAELYYSKELRKAARFLIPAGDMWEDLLSDAILKVFEKSDEEIFAIQRPVDFVFLTMRNMAYRPNEKWMRQFGSMESHGVFDREHVHVAEGEHDGIFVDFGNRDLMDSDSDYEVLDITTDEKKHSERIFGGVSAGSVALMRALDQADGLKMVDRSRWEQAQMTKMYLDFGSYRKVEKATGICYQQVRTHVKNFTSSITDKRMNIAVVTRGAEPQSGMELYRLQYPYFDGLGDYHTTDFSVKRVSYEYIASQPPGGLEDDVYVFSRLQHPELADKVLEADKKLVIDIDDYWKVHREHHFYNTEENNRYVSGLLKSLSKAHLVTCSTGILAERLEEELGITATVIKNTIPKETSQFSPVTLPHSKVRFGWIGGVFHKHDLFQVYDGMKKLWTTPELNGKYQICLGGFNVTGEGGRMFVDYEKILTCDYRSLLNDSEYMDYLQSYTPALDHIGYNKPYRRMWAKSVTTYGQMYREINVALIPLADISENGTPIHFNACKSELKLIEAGTTGKAAIVSDVLPYSPHIKNEENCLTVSSKRREWYTQIRRMILDEDLRKETAANLTKYVNKNFNHKVEAGKLAEAIKQL